MKLKGAVAVITGASRGLGRELALALAHEGCQLIVGARTGLEELRQQIDHIGVPYYPCSVDLATEQGLSDFETFIQRKANTVDILVNNLGYIHPARPAEELDWQEFKLSFFVNLFVPISLTRMVLPQMRAQNSGTVVNVASISGRRGTPWLSAYCASKFAVRGFTESLASELKGTEVRCFSVSPGGMNTEMRASARGKADAAQQQSPRSVAAQIIDAIGKDAAYVPIGADLVVRGGQAAVIIPETQLSPAIHS